MNIDLFDDIIRTHNQDSEASDLWRAIQQATGCTVAEAKAAAKKHCNSLSFYALCVARGFIMFGYSIWVEKLVAVDYLDVMSGWLKADKLKIAALFGFDSQFNALIYYKNYDEFVNAVGLDESKGYNIKVYNNYNKNNAIGGGDHFMGGYVFTGSLYVSDPGKRGIRVPAKTAIPKEKFQWGLLV